MRVEEKRGYPNGKGPEVLRHCVRRGETLVTIAEHYYGDARLCAKIFEANRDVLTDTNQIRHGLLLLIP